MHSCVCIYVHVRTRCRPRCCQEYDHPRGWREHAGTLGSGWLVEEVCWGYGLRLEAQPKLIFATVSSSMGLGSFLPDE